MTHCEINGIQVLFPFKPYSVQEAYMKKVIECLQKGSNGILESPTGTGKTFSLLCSTLAWLESYKAKQQLDMIRQSDGENGMRDLKLALDSLAGHWDTATNFLTPKIIYSSRTHSQLSQAIQELKRSSYNHVRSIVLGSRDQLCLHPEVSKAPNHTAKMYMCRAKTNNKTCVYHLNYEEKIASKSEYHDTPVLDIEDLMSLGRKNKVCPYFAARHLKSKCDMIFTPYNYIIDPKSRRAHGIELTGNVVIFDEAHNIEGACEESMSFQLRSYDLALCITEVTHVMDMIKDFDESFSSPDATTPPDFTMADLAILKVMFCELEDLLDKELLECSATDGSKPGDYMIELLSKVELSAEKKDVVLDVLDKVILYLSTKSQAAWSSKGAGLQKFSDLISILFSRTSTGGYRAVDFKKEYSLKYRVFLQPETINKSKADLDPWTAPTKGSIRKKSWKLDCWCFSPGIGMKDIVDQGVHSILLTSGTLSPLGPMVNELAVSFPVQLENPHIVKDNQVFVGVVTCGPDGTPLNSSFQNRSNERYISSLGRTICNFCRMIPDGLLVFFPSYSVMKSNVEKWEDNGVWQSLSGLKPIFTEPQGRDAFQESIEKYYSVIKEPESKGATLLAVCRGKVSEGLDFADENARAVVITGLPFPPAFDPRVKMKMNYLNGIAKENKGLYGNDWYVLQASRAVNQAIGRVIRHVDDFGAILLCDNRFKDKRIQNQLSKWIQGRIHVFDTFGPALKHLANFYKGLDQLPRKSKSDNSIGSFQVGSSRFTAGSMNHIHPHSTGTSLINERIAEPTEKIFEGYKQKDMFVSTSKEGASCSSIFDVMDDPSPPINAAQPYKPSPLSKYSSSGYDSKESDSVLPSSAKPNPKKRKITIALRQAIQPEKEKSSTEMWKKFLLEVKGLLGVTEQYGKFCSCVKNFKTSKDVDKFAEAIKSIFSSIPNKSKFIQTASLLVGASDRDRFLAKAS